MKKANYRLGGLVLLPFALIAVALGVIFKAPVLAICSIAFFGISAAIVLIILGDRRTK